MKSTMRHSVLFCFLLLLSAPLKAQTNVESNATTSDTSVTSKEATGVQSPEATHKYATVYGAKIHYIEAGSGPTVVLLHGLGGSAGDFVFNVSTLSKKFRVIVPDQLGFGLSDKPIISYRIATYVDFLDRLLSDLKIKRVSLVGNSLGGWIAASYALAHPERVERLVLVDAAGFALPADFDTSQLKGLNPSTRDGIRQLVARGFYNTAVFGSDAFIDMALTQRINAGDGHTIASLIEVIMRREESLDKRLGAIKQPTLIIWGREDKVVPLADGERFKREIATAQLLVFDRCGHIPQIEKALAFNTAVTDFLTKNAK